MFISRADLTQSKPMVKSPHKEGREQDNKIWKKQSAKQRIQMQANSQTHTHTHTHTHSGNKKNETDLP